jgi:hypothetical protein
MKNKVAAGYILAILVMTYFYCFYVATHPKLPKKIRDIHHSCVFGECQNNNCKKVISYRGDNYTIEDIDAKKKDKIRNCSFTFWNLSHFTLYAILTYLCPEFYMEFFLMGIGFEAYECVVYDCHDVMDVIANTAGIATGLFVSSAQERSSTPMVSNTR